MLTSHGVLPIGGVKQEGWVNSAVFYL